MCWVAKAAGLKLSLFWLLDQISTGSSGSSVNSRISSPATRFEASWAPVETWMVPSGVTAPTQMPPRNMCSTLELRGYSQEGWYGETNPLPT